MMRHFNISLACAAALFLFAGCSVEGLRAPEPSDGKIQVVGRITPFNETNARMTKSVKSNDESVVTNMAMFVFDNDDKLVDYQFTLGSKPLFMIDRTSESQPYKHWSGELSNSHIFIVANIPSACRDAFAAAGADTDLTKDELKDIDFSVAGAIPVGGVQSYGGLPMYGESEAIDLGPGSDLSGNVLEIPLTCLFSKVTFNIIVVPDQRSDKVQSFDLSSWEVENVPKNVCIAYDDAGESKNARLAKNTKKTFYTVDNNVDPVEQILSDNVKWSEVAPTSMMCFSMYVPEHRVTPSLTPEYPTTITADAKQMWKPAYVGEDDEPLKVTIHGTYSDHRGLDKDVHYTIYPGLNNYDNFEIERNCEYVNNITIKGVTNSMWAEEESVSFDLRVDMSQTSYRFQIERETLLDSHWEIRPMRVVLDPRTDPQYFEGSHIEIELMDDGDGLPGWIRFEMPSDSDISSNAGTYCQTGGRTDLAYGKRRYFTSDLLTNTLNNTSKASTSNALIKFGVDFPSNSGATNGYEHTIWAYIDENTTIPDSPGSSTRQAHVQCRFYLKDQSGDNYEVKEDYYFIQRGLHRIDYGGRAYGIEYFEEYLYNFDAKEGYGATTDGMAWGLNGVQLSTEENAIFCEGILSDEAATNAVRTAFPNAKYDFYINAEEAAGGHLSYFPYSGQKFTKKIVSEAGIGALATNEQPSSAVEYCLNKNRRSDSGGTVAQADIKWYLPAIDEIEAVCSGGYSDFEVFQNKYYWSSQPAFHVYDMTYSSLGSTSGHFFMDNTSNARATKVDDAGKTVGSGETDASIRYTFSYWNQSSYGTESTGKTPTLGPGNQARSNINRIRCLYAGDFSVKIQSVHDFESGASANGWTASQINQSTSSKHGGSYAGQTASNRTNTLTYSTKMTEPEDISFWVYSTNTSTSGTWYIEVSSNGTSGWTSVKTQASNISSWTQVSADLSSQKNVYVRIRHYNGSNTQNRNTRFIDDIVLNYSQHQD